MKRFVIMVIAGFICLVGSGNLDAASTGKNFTVRKFSGEVKKGELFERKISDQLYFRLRPLSDGSGWYVTINEKGRDLEDYSIVTFPLRGKNPKYIKVAESVRPDPLLGAKRSLDFVLTYADYKLAWRSARMLLWKEGYSEKELQEARSILFDSTNQAKAIVTLISSNSSKISNLHPDSSRERDLLRFQVTVIPPQQTISAFSR